MPWLVHLPAIPVILPLLVAAILAAASSYLPRRLLDITALLTCAAVFACCCLLVHNSEQGTIVYWFGNWKPDAQSHFPVGISFVIDPIGAGLAALVSFLGFMAFAFSWSYFEQIKALYHTLMLAFIGAMCGLCLTGDLFNLFVWFELMTAASVALCGYKSEESWPLLGALNFAVVNTVGAFLSLAGVAMLYAQTGSLNMAQVGRSLVDHPTDSTFLMVCFLFVSAGFMVKMAAVPFQFWLADAHAVAPTPVCILFSGVMVELGIYAIARLHWTVFAPAFTPQAEAAMRSVFLLMGCITALAGAFYCFAQRHLKRMLAFSTISHVGLMVIGFALLDPHAFSGASIYVIGHGLIKGALFIGAGILLHRCGSVDEYDLRGDAQNLKFLGIILPLGALGLAGLPPFATFIGQDQIHEAAEHLHDHWLTPVVVICEAFTAAAVLRFNGRVFFGWGPRREATSRGAPHIPMDTETAEGHQVTPVWMWAPALMMLAIALGIGLSASFRASVLGAAHRFERPVAIHALTLDATPEPAEPQPAPPEIKISAEKGFTLAIAIALAAIALWPQVLGRRLNWLTARTVNGLMKPLHKLQSGNIGDYIAWFAFGMAAYGGLLLLYTNQGH